MKPLPKWVSYAALAVAALSAGLAILNAQADVFGTAAKEMFGQVTTVVSAVSAAVAALSHSLTGTGGAAPPTEGGQ